MLLLATSMRKISRGMETAFLLLSWATMATVSDEGDKCSISINIDGSVFEICFDLTVNAATVVSDFLERNGLDTDYQPAVEVEVLRAQLKLSSNFVDKCNKLQTSLTRKISQCVVAEQRATLAEKHAVSLSSSLKNVELMLPVLLKAKHPNLGQLEGPANRADADFVGYLRELLHQHEYIAQGTQDGSLSHSEWEELVQEEESLLSHRHDFASPTLAFRSASGDNYDQLAETDESQPHSWKNRYLHLRGIAKSLSNNLHTTHHELEQARKEIGAMSKTVLNDELLQENDALRDQTIRLRGEILKLREHIAEVKTSAAQAMRTMSELGKEMIQSEAATISRSASKNNSRNNSRSATPVGHGVPSNLLYNNNNNSSHVNLGEHTRLEYVHPVQDDILNSERDDQHDHHNNNNNNHRHPAPHAAGTSPAPPLSSRSDSDAHLSETKHSPLPLPTEPVPLLPPEDPLELALRSVQVPVVSDRLLHLLFNRFSSLDGKANMNSFRYLRLLKECSITLSDEEVDNNILNNVNSRYLSYGVVSIVFNDALKEKIHEKLDKSDKHASNPSSKDPAKHTYASTITLKGSAAVHPTSLLYPQFLIAVRNLALRLYADIVLAEFGVPVEQLQGPARETASFQALELLMQDKIVPLAVKQDFMPWPLVHLERALFACAHIPAAFQAFSKGSKDLASWFVHYAGLSGGLVEAKNSFSGMAPLSGGKTGPAHVAVSLFDSEHLTVSAKSLSGSGSGSGSVEGKQWSIHDGSQAGMSYKALSLFAHDFGLVPYLFKEPQLFGMYQELLAWTHADPLVSPEALPEVVSRALSAALPRAMAIYLQRTPSQSVPPQKTKSNANHEKISLATFAVALCIVAMQAFPQEVDGRRAVKLMEWLQQGGGPSIIARDGQ